MKQTIEKQACDNDLKTIPAPAEEIAEAQRIAREFANLPVCSRCGGVEYYYVEGRPGVRYCNNCETAMHRIRLERLKEFWKAMASLSFLNDLWDSGPEVVWRSKSIGDISISHRVKSAVLEWEQFTGSSEWMRKDRYTNQ